MRGKLAWAPAKWPKRRAEGPPVQVLRGRVRLTAGDASWEGRSGDLLVVPGTRHALHAVEDSAILLTVSMAVRPDRR